MSYRKLSLLLIIPFLIISFSCKKEEEPAVEPTPVAIITVSHQSISREITATCRLEGIDEAIIYPALGGKIEAVLVSEGDSVKTGDPLVTLASDVHVTAGVTISQAGISAAEANAENAELNLSRMQELFQAGAISQQALNAVEAANETAQAQLQQAYAGAQQAYSTVDNSIITAPFDGRIGRIWARVGNMAGGAPLLSISNNSTVIARALFPECELGNIIPDLPAHFSASAYDGRSFPGVVTSVARTVDPISGLVPAEIQLAGIDSLSSGMTGRVTVAVETHPNVLIVPEIALRRTGSGYELALYKNGIVSIIEVETGITNSGNVEIVSGLQPGDNVIVQGQNRVADGDAVRIP